MDGYTSSSTTRYPWQRHLLKRALHQSIAIIALLGAALPADAASIDKAKRMYDRLTGVPAQQIPSNDLQKMQLAIDGNGGCGLGGAESGGNGCSPLGAAYFAMTNKAFYTVKLKNWATPWTNRDGNKFAPLNDYTATVIGLVRDSEDYRQVLYGDVVYVGTANAGVAAYSNSNNQHYEQLEAKDTDLSSNANFEKKTQSSMPGGLAAGATAGIMTTRAAARAFFIDGTNRAMFRFTLKNHLCNDMEQVQDITRPSDRIRQDVPRSPGGDSRIFMNTCIGCHSGMDPMAQAFAYYNFKYDTAAADEDAAKEIGHLTYKDPDTGSGPGGTEKKYHINTDHFVDGYVTDSEQWDNYWRDGPDTAIFGWAPSGGSGVGAKSMGQELANSEAFAVCSVKKVFQTICLRDPAGSDQGAFTVMLNNFKSGYDLKHTFAEAAVYCSGN